jgi:hypothetical protein
LAKLPEPPSVATLRALGPQVYTLASGELLWRIYYSGGAHPTVWDGFRAWGPAEARFDHHTKPPRLQSRGILYTAAGPHAALTTIAEVFQATRVVERTRGAPALMAFKTTRPLQLLDLTGLWPTRAGASTAICSGPRPRTRRWSQAIYAAFPDLDGLRYAASMNAGEPAVVLYERAKDAMPAHPSFNRQLGDPLMMTMLKNAARKLNYLLE